MDSVGNKDTECQWLHLALMYGMGGYGTGLVQAAYAVPTHRGFGWGVTMKPLFQMTVGEVILHQQDVPSRFERNWFILARTGTER